MTLAVLTPAVNNQITWSHDERL